MRQRIIFGLMILIVLFVIPLLSADCPAGFVCGGTEIEITIQSGMFCTSDGENWINYSASPAQTNPTIGLGNCYEPGAVGDKFCCPAGSECSPTGQTGPEGELYNCIYTDKDFCWKLDTEPDCTNYTKWVAVNSIEAHEGEGYCGIDDDWWQVGNSICWYETSCGCEWDSANQNCTAIDNRTSVCNDTFVPVQEGVCTYTMETWQDNCEIDGFIYASWSALGTGIYAVGGNGCEDTGVITIPCEKIVKLDFFTWLNILVVVLILVLIYYSYVQAKKKKK